MQKFTRFLNAFHSLRQILSGFSQSTRSLSSIAAIALNSRFGCLLLVCCLGFTGLQGWGQTIGQRSAILDQYGKLPLAFEANHGQTDSSVTYLSRSEGYTLWLTPSEAVFGFSQPDKTTASFRLSLVGANLRAPMAGEQPLAGHTNYLLGPDPSQWKHDVPNFERVRATGIYPGIDMVYYGNHHQLEYDFNVAPKADASRIALKIRGGEQVKLDADGNLVIGTAAGPFIFRKPVAYQSAPDGQRQPVEASYRLDRNGQVRFQLGRYDRNRELIIDPSVAYSTFIGGASLATVANSVVVDAQGSAYLTGYVEGLGFPTTPGAFQTTITAANPNTQTPFVTKLSPDGSSLVYSTLVGANDSASFASAIALDAQGNAYVTGQTDSLNFPTTAGAFQGGVLDPNIFSTNTNRGFVFKLNSSGSALLYSTLLHGSGATSANHMDQIQVDSAGNAFVIGGIETSDFPTTPGVFRPAAIALTGGILVKLNPTGTALVYSTYTFGSFSTQDSLVVDGAGNAYIAGLTAGVSSATNQFVTTPGVFQSSDPAPSEVGPRGFVAKFNPQATELVFSTLVTSLPDSIGSVRNTVQSLALDGSGNIYIVGDTWSPNWPVTAGAFQATIGGGTGGPGFNDAFVAKLSPDASALLYSSYLGGSNEEFGGGIVVDPSGQVAVTIQTQSTDFPCTAQHISCTLSRVGQFVSPHDLALSIVNAGGTALTYSTYVGPNDFGGTPGNGGSLAQDSALNLYIGGRTAGANFPTTPGAFQSTYPGGGDSGYVIKISPNAASMPVIAYSPTSLAFANQTVGTSSAAKTITVSNTGNAALTLGGFSFSGAGDFKETTTTCGASLAAGATCTFNIVFTPLVTGAISDTVQITSNASGVPPTVALSGTGVAPAAPTVTLTPASLTFGNQVQGTSSTPQAITVANTGNAPLTGISITLSANYSFTTNCGATLAAGATCSISVTFSPTTIGSLPGQVAIADNASNSPQKVALTGTGLAASTPDYGVSTTSGSATVVDGQAATFTINVSGAGGAFNTPVTLTATGLPPGATATFNPASLTPGAGTATSTLTIQTAKTAAMHQLRLWSLGVPAFAFILLAVPRRRRAFLHGKSSLMLCLLVTLAVGITMTGCGGGSAKTPPAATFTITISATSGATVHTTTVNLTVQ